MTTLKELGYSKKDIQVMSDPEFAYVRFSPEEVLFLHSMVGKVVTVRSTYANTVRTETFKVLNVNVHVTAAGFFKPDMVNCLDKRSVVSAMQTGIFERDRRGWNYKDGVLTYPGEAALKKATAWKKQNELALKQLTSR